MELRLDTNFLLDLSPSASLMFFVAFSHPPSFCNLADNTSAQVWNMSSLATNRYGTERDREWQSSRRSTGYASKRDWHWACWIFNFKKLHNRYVRKKLVMILLFMIFWVRSLFILGNIKAFWSLVNNDNSNYWLLLSTCHAEDTSLSALDALSHLILSTVIGWSTTILVFRWH